MKGLVLKDFYNMKSTLLMLCGVLIFIGAMAVSKGENFASSISVVLVMLPVAIVTNTFGFDEKVKWENYAITMPITRKDIIKSKYITLIISVIAATAFITIVNIFIQVLSSRIIFSGIVETISFGFSVGIIFSAIIIPIVCKFGLEKMRILLMLIVVIPCLIIAYLQDNVNQIKTLFNLNVLINYGVYIIPVIAILLCFISYLISVKIYEKKEF